jgi:hypothetical protein
MLQMLQLGLLVQSVRSFEMPKQHLPWQLRQLLQQQLLQVLLLQIEFELALLYCTNEFYFSSPTAHLSGYALRNDLSTIEVNFRKKGLTCASRVFKRRNLCLTKSLSA